MTDDELHVGDDGLWIPPELREFDQQIVIRTPRVTIQHFSGAGTLLDGYYGMVGADHFGDAVDDAQNPDLQPDRVSIKPQGEDARVFRVEADPDVRCDGGGTVRDAGDIRAKIDELHAFDDYPNGALGGAKGRDLRYKHQGWIDALRWVLGSDVVVEP